MSAAEIPDEAEDGSGQREAVEPITRVPRADHHGQQHRV